MPPQAAALPNCGAVDAHGPRPTAAAYVARHRCSESERAATTIGRRRKGSARAPDAPPRPVRGRAIRLMLDASCTTATVTLPFVEDVEHASPGSGDVEDASPGSGDVEDASPGNGVAKANAGGTPMDLE